MTAWVTQNFAHTTLSVSVYFFVHYEMNKMTAPADTHAYLNFIHLSPRLLPECLPATQKNPCCSVIPR